jgi:hypothetical protein
MATTNDLLKALAGASVLYFWLFMDKLLFNLSMLSVVFRSGM